MIGVMSAIRGFVRCLSNFQTEWQGLTSPSYVQVQLLLFEHFSLVINVGSGESLPFTFYAPPLFDFARFMKTFESSGDSSN